jgi:hypothetical protein
MSKVIFTIVILAIVSCSLCNDFLIDTSAQANSYMDNYEQINPEDFLKFAAGANEGFGFFYNLPNYDQCVMYDPKITQIAQDIFNIVKGLNIGNAINFSVMS